MPCFPVSYISQLDLVLSQSNKIFVKDDIIILNKIKLVINFIIKFIILCLIIINQRVALQEAGAGMTSGLFTIGIVTIVLHVE